MSLEQVHVTLAVLLRDGASLAPRQEEVIRSGDTLILVGAHDDLMQALSRLEGE